MAKSRGRFGRRAFRIERLELRTMLASDVVWNNSNWDEVPSLKDEIAAYKQPDGLFYVGDSKPVGVSVASRQLVISWKDGLADSALLQQGMTFVRTLDRRADVYELDQDLTPDLLQSIASNSQVLYTAPVYKADGFDVGSALLDEVIVALKPGTAAASFFENKPEIAQFRPLDGTPDQFVATVSLGYGRPTLDVANVLNLHPAVQWVSPNFYTDWKLFFTPNDPRFSNQWHLQNSGQGGGVVGADANLVPAWDVNQGGSSNIVVSVVDTGVQLNHPDLRIWTNPGEIAGDNIDNDGNGWVDDVNGWDFVRDNKDPGPKDVDDNHGTSVAGVAAGAGDNNLGIAGASFNSLVMSVKIFEGFSATSEANIASSLYYSGGRTRNGLGTWKSADIVNNSWGGGPNSTAINNAIRWGTTSGRQGTGAAYFFATGNDYRTTISQPAAQSLNIPGLIAIGATNNFATRSDYSNYGAGVSFVAPSNDLRSGYLAIDTTDRTGADGYANGDYTGTGAATGFGGTSSATPLAAGIGALVFDQARVVGETITPAQLRSYMENSTDLIGGVSYDIVTGKNNQFGSGRIDAHAAVYGVGKAKFSIVDTSQEFADSSIINFGTAISGQSVDKVFRIRNQGTQPLQLQQIRIGAPFEIGVAPGETILNIGESTNVTLRFAPTTGGTYNVPVFFDTNDPDVASFQLNLVGDTPGVAGFLYEDYNGNGQKSASDPGRSDIGFAYIDSNNNQRYDASEIRVTPDSSGAFVFNGLGAGTYTIRSSLNTGWNPTGPASGSYVFTLTGAGDVVPSLDFGAQVSNTSYSYVYVDKNLSFTPDSGDTPVNGLRVFEDLNKNGVWDKDLIVVGNAPLALPDLTTVSATAAATDTSRVKSLTVTLNLTHTWMSDLRISLISPTGTEVLLADDIGFDDDGFNGTTFDDSAPDSISVGSYPYTGRFQPLSPLAAFSGEVIAGLWRLQISDLVGGDSGTLTSWSITFQDFEQSSLSNAEGYVALGVTALNSKFIVTPTAPYECLNPADGTHTISPTNGVIIGFDFGMIDSNLPPYDLAAAPLFVYENKPIGTSVGTLTGFDYNRADTFTYSLVPGAGDDGNNAFTISGNQILSGQSFDFESQSVYTIRVRTEDSSGIAANYREDILTITIGDVNEPPSDLGLTGNTIPENEPKDRLIGVFNSVDPDTGDVLTFKLADPKSAPDNLLFKIIGDQLYSAVTFDFEARKVFTIDVIVSDIYGETLERLFDINITDVNEAPTSISINADRILENMPSGTVIGDLSAVDVDAGDSYTLSLVDGQDGDDNAKFTLIGTTLSSANTFDFESQTTQKIRVRATDSQGLTFESALVISVLNVNESPTDISVTPDTVPESQPIGTTVGKLTTKDLDNDNVFRYEFANGAGADDNALFSIVGDELRTLAVFDYDVKRDYSLRIRTTDLGGLSVERVVAVHVSNINDPPTNISLSNPSVAENSPLGTVVGSFSTTDADDTDTFTYSLVPGTGDADNTLFTVNGNQLLTNNVFNFEARSVFSVRVRSKDSGGLLIEKPFTINVTNVNEVPLTIRLSKRTVPENSPANTLLGTLSTTDTDSLTDTVFAYSLVNGSGDSDNGVFAISGNQVLLVGSLNFEQRNSLSIRVRSTDLGGLFTEEVFAVSVTNVNEAPTVVNLSNSSIAENQPIGTVVGLLSNDDPDFGDAHSYSLEPGAGSTDNALFTINGDQLLAFQPFDFEAKSSYSVRIRATDRIGAFVESVRVITILDVNEAPSSLTLVGGQIPENSPIGTEVGKLVASDPDAGAVLSYSLVNGSGSDDNGSFTLVGDKLFSNTAVNFENKSSYSIRARVSDQFGLALEKSFVISILNVNEQPVQVSLSPNTIFEGMAIGTAVGTLSTVDPDNADSFSYSLVSGAGDADNASFTIVGSQVRSSAVFDFDVKSSYSIRVRTTDAGGLSTEMPLVIQVINVNDPPTNIVLSSTTIQENVPLGTPLGTLSTTDADDSDTFTYSLVAGLGDTSNTNWLIVGNQLVSNNSINFEQTKFQQVRIKTVDAGGLAFEKAFVITILDVNEAPTAIGISGLAIDENSAVGTTIGTLSSTDPDAGDTFTYSLVSGAGSDDNSAFTITGMALKSSQVFDFETKSSYQVRIRSTDAKGLFTEAMFLITVRNVNEVPLSTSLTPASIPENSPAGTVVGTFSTSDPDAGDNWTYSLVSGTGSTDNGMFAIVGSSLQATQSLNFEVTPSLSIRVRTRDSGGLTRENVFVISVLNQNDTPSQLSLSGATVLENRPIGTTIGSLSTTDEDTGDTHSYSLVSGAGDTDNSVFSIISNSLKTNAVFDFESKKSYSVRIASTDSQGARIERSFVISVLNENEAPSNVVLSPSSILENRAANSLVGLLSTTDVDAGDSFSYQIVPQQGSFDHLAFSITGNQLRSTRPFNFEEQSSFAITVRSTDLAGLSIDGEITVDVGNVEEAPVDLKLVGNTIPEGYPPGSPIGTLLAVDPDLAGQVAFSLVSGATDNALFQVSGTQLLSNAIFNFESRANYTVLIRATDVAGTFTEKSFTILVDDVNESASSIQLSNTVMPENSTNLLVGILSTNDPDQNETMFYRLVPGTGADDNLQFVIVGDKLYAKTAWDYETKSSYRLRIEGIDSANHSVVAPFIIQVTDVNDSPTSMTLTPSSIPENSPANTQVGTLNAIDQDAGDTFTFKFADGSTTSPSGRFAIVGNKLVALQSFDYETATSYSESIVVTDLAGATFATQLVIAIANVNERPTNIRLSNQAVDENKPIGSLVGILSVDDVDSPDTATYALVSGSGSFDNSQFRITGNRLETNAKFNYELRDSYSVRVRITDAGGLTFEKPFVVTINNIAELPPVTVSDNYRTSYGRPITMNVLSNDYGVSSPLDPSTVRILTQPAQGTAAVLANGSIQYTHSVATSTQVMLQYDVRDENGVTSNLGNVVITFYSAFQNQVNNLDVDGDSLITPLDPLAIVNYINAHPGNGQLPLNSPDLPPFVDVDGDGFSTPLDVLFVVNKLNSNATGGGGEGEGIDSTANVASTARVSSTAADSIFASYGWSDDDSTISNWIDGSGQRGSGRFRRRA